MSKLKLGVLAEPALVGREKELEELQHYLDGVVEGKGNTVFISGEAGSGKTRVTREFLNNARRRGIAVMAGWCLSDSQVPYFPFMEAFNSYYAASGEEEAQSNLLQSQAQLGLGTPVRVGLAGGEGEITSWLTGARQAGKPIMLSAQAWKDQVFAAVSETLHTVAIQGPVVLFIEDVHWADSASLALLHYVSRAISNSERILLLATYRSEELTTDAEGHAHPLAETLRMMRREELFTEIKLSNLGQDSVSKIAESMMGSRLQLELAGKLSDESRGNPLFVVESLRMLHEHKSLVQENNEWRLAVDELGIPSKIRDVILRRLACLKYAQRRVLDAASVIGEEFDVELLSTVLGQDYLEILETLNVVAHSTSLVSVEGNHYRFDHARSRETLYEELALPLKRGYHNKIAEKLESANNEAPRLSDIAFHFAQAGNRQKAVKYALTAGKDELAKYSNTQAVKHFRYVLQNLSGECADERRVALEGLGDAYAASSMFGEAIKTFDDLAVSETGILKLRAIRKATDAAYAKGDMPDLLIEYAKKAEALGLDDRLEMARIINNRGKAWGWGGRGTFEQDLDDYDAALRVFEEENSLVDIAEALHRSGVVCIMFDHLHERSVGELVRSCAIFNELGEIRREIQSTFWRGHVLCHMWLFPWAKPAFENVLLKGEKLGVFFEMYQTCQNLMDNALIEGRIDEAFSYAQRMFEYSNKTDSLLYQGNAAFRLAAMCSLKGELGKADEFFGKAVKLMPVEFALNPLWYVAGYSAIYYAARGQWDRSKENLKKQLDWSARVTGGGALEDLSLINGIALVLVRQGRFEEAKVQQENARKLLVQVDEFVEKRFGHANIQLSVMLPRKFQVGSEVEMRLDFVNAGKKPGLLARVEGVVLPEFDFHRLPSSCSLQNGGLVLNDKSVGPFEIETVKLKLSATKAGSYSLNPEVFYLDDLGNTKTFQLNSITVTVEPVKPAYEVLPGRVTTGMAEVDRLLLGGIPEGYAVELAAPSSDERELLIKRFLEAGAEAGETTLYLTTEASTAKTLAENYQSDFSVFICNPQADAMIENLPNVTKLKGVESLTEIDIALTKYFRSLNPAKPGLKRACIQIVSDVLLQHHAVITRKWLSSLLANLKSKGFTTLAVIDPGMHPPEETQAILGLSDGEIRMLEKEDSTKALKVTKLHDQGYLKDEVALG